MPELPEVETVRLGLEPALEGHVITQAIVRRGDLRIPFPPRFAERLTGRKVVHLSRRAKYLLAALDKDNAAFAAQNATNAQNIAVVQKAAAADYSPANFHGAR